jgi:hypothetical protein
MRWKTEIHDPSEWHRWFAWYPVEFVDDIEGHKVTVWLESVERRQKKFPLLLVSEIEYEYRNMLDVKP